MFDAGTITALTKVSPWLALVITFLTFLWRMKVLQFDVSKTHDEKLGGYADRIEGRLEHCEAEREELRQQSLKYATERGEMLVEMAIIREQINILKDAKPETPPNTPREETKTKGA